MADELEREDELEEETNDEELEAEESQEDETPPEEEEDSAEDETPPEEILPEEAPPEAPTSRQPATLGMIRDLQAERQRTKDAKAEAEALRRKIERLESGSVGEDGDEYLTKAELEERLRKDRETEEHTILEDCSMVAAETYSVEKMGYGLDWDTVATAFDQMVERRPAIYDFVVDDAINTRQDPAKAVYEFVTRNHPEFIKRGATQKNAKNTKRLAAIAKEAVVTSGASGNEPTRPARDPYKMSAAELRKDLGEEEPD